VEGPLDFTHFIERQ